MTQAEKRQIWDALYKCTRTGYPGATYEEYDSPKDPRVRGGRYNWTRSQLYELYEKLVVWGEANAPEAAWRVLQEYKTKIPPACLRAIYQSISFIPVVPPTVTTGAVNPATILSTSLSIINNAVTDLGFGMISNRGIVYRYGFNPDSIKSIGSGGLGTFTVPVTGLIPATKYSFEAFATNIAGTSYGTTANFTTRSAPITGTATSITTTGATISNNNTGPGTVIPTLRGICYSSVNTVPTTADTVVNAAAGLMGAYTLNTGVLSPNVTYYVRAYSTITAVGAGYGSVVSFLTLPTVTTGTVTFFGASQINITGSSVSGGLSATITDKGVCYSSVNNNPTIADSILSAGSGTGTFDSIILGLNDSTVYYIRAYGTNATGTNYGVLRTVTTQARDIKPDPTPNWSNVYLDISAGDFYVAVQQIQGINEEITLSLTYDDKDVDFYYRVTNTAPAYTNGGIDPAGLTDPGWVEVVTSPTLVNIDPNEYLSIGCNSGSLLTVKSELTIRNVDDGNFLLDIVKGEASSSPPVPSVTTGTVGSITSSGAVISNNNVTNDRGFAVTVRGICYSDTNSSPTLADSVVNALTAGTGLYNITLSGLNSSTLYYATAYATNVNGTTYGTGISFTTSSADVTPNPTPVWADIYGYPNFGDWQYGVQQITGITVPITIDLTLNWVGSPPGIAYYQVTSTLPIWTNGGSDGTDPGTYGFVPFVTGEQFVINPGEYLSFATDNFGVLGSIVVVNVSDSNTILNTVNITT